VNEANIEDSILASNGIVYVIDAVLIPPSPPTKAPPAPPAPTKAPPTPEPPTDGGCNLLKVGFDKDANGQYVEKGRYVQNEWLAYGLALFAEGGQGSLPRIFDSSDPGSQDTCGDADLGSPNKWCPGGYGPGHGVGGEPGAPGENCEPLGNLLIIQEPGSPCPDDNVNGGIITLDFPYPWGQYVDSIGLVDIDYASSIVVVYETKYGFKEYTITVPLLGDNSAQTIDIKQDNVRWIKVMLSRSGAVSFIKFCPK